MIYVTRKAHFSASHRLYNPEFSDQQNQEIFDKCNNPNGHGHNYVVEVTVKGVPDPQTGYVIDLKKLARILDREIIDKVDHKHLNHDVDFLRGIIPTAENLAVVFWGILKSSIPSGELHSIKVFESDNNFVEYYGEPIQLVRYGLLNQEGVEV
ncbi:MAG: 6-carboxytetrahydropterin synthase [Ignavibacteriae bacterium]|nr:6-carboxytetrahydropterin synthase [Ignavibacteriota bacterium]MCB9215669.1 6-carboxytetrahydropterin synthase [Ignavibacteria bacterium]